MKNKKITYILIFSVVALWGIIFYRIFIAMGDKEETIVQVPAKKAAYFKMVNHQNDQVLLTFDYRDPFTSINAIEPITPAQSQNTAPMPIPLPIAKPVVNWSAISYTGYINNLNTKQKLAMLSVNGKELMLAEGQDLNGVKLLKYAGDSIKVKYQNETRYIRLR